MDYLNDNKDSLDTFDQGDETAEKAADIAASPLRKKISDYTKESLGELKGILSDKAKEAIANALKSTTEELLGTSFSATLGTIGIVLLVILMVLCIVPLCIYTVQYIDGEDPKTIVEPVLEAIENEYKDVKRDSMILETLNSTYDCEFAEGDIYYNHDGSIDFIKKGCEIHVDFAPDLEEIAKIVSAYTTATNGALAYHSLDLTMIDSNIVIDKKTGDVIGYDSGDVIDGFDDASNFIDVAKTETAINKLLKRALPIDLFSSNNLANGHNEELINEYDSMGNDLKGVKLNERLQEEVENVYNHEVTNASTEEFAELIRERSITFFTLGAFEVWEKNTIKKHIFTYYNEVCSTSESEEIVAVENSKCELDPEHYEYKKLPYYIEGYKGSVEIPIFFDLSDYKEQELMEAASNMDKRDRRCVFEWDSTGDIQGSDDCTIGEANQVLTATYLNYFDFTKKLFDVDEHIMNKYMIGNTGSGQGDGPDGGRYYIVTQLINGWGYPFTTFHKKGDDIGWYVVYGQRLWHNGVDFSASCGTDIYTVCAGRVMYAGYNSSKGNYVEIMSDEGLLVRYYHLQSPTVLKIGSYVSAGTYLGDVGTTGFSTGCHLHLGVSENGNYASYCDIIDCNNPPLP